MAYASLSDIIEPKVFARYVTEAVVAKSALLSSGAVLTSNEMNTYAGQAGRVVDLPNFSDLTWAAPDIAKDDSTAATINNVTTAHQLAVKNYVSRTWGSAALTASVSGEDIVGHIANEVVAPYWVQSVQQYALAMLSGVIKKNIASNGGDMVKDVTNDVAGTPAAATVANVGNILEAIQTMGDARDKADLIIMSSRVYTNLLKQEPTNFTPVSQTQAFQTYLGLRVIVDDSLPAVAGTNQTAYTTYILGRGALLFGEATPEMGGVSVQDNPTLGNGWGAQTLTSRKQFILHPAGHSCSATVSSGFGSPTTTAFDASGAWARVYSRKNVPIIALKTNA